jgi:hypothetical protein
MTEPAMAISRTALKVVARRRPRTLVLEWGFVVIERKREKLRRIGRTDQTGTL